MFSGVWYAAGPSLATCGGARERRKKARAMYDQIGSVEAWQCVLLDADLESISFLLPKGGESSHSGDGMVRMFLSAKGSMVVRTNRHMDPWMVRENAKSDNHTTMWSCVPNVIS